MGKGPRTLKHLTISWQKGVLSLFLPELRGLRPERLAWELCQWMVGLKPA